jgi:predicted nucleotidyltransferase
MENFADHCATCHANEGRQGLVNKTFGIFSILQSALHPLAKRVLVAFVYGSVAREEKTAQSDLDLLVVGKATLEEVLSRLSRVENSIRVLMAPVRN